MNVLGINCYLPGSSVSLLSNNKIVSAIKESSFTENRLEQSFPSNSLRSIRSYDNLDYIAFANNKHINQFKRDIKGYSTAKIEKVDYLDALAMSSIVTTSWDSCAVIVVDTWHVSLGYYTDKQFYWVKHFEYPNNICLFYSAATRFLGKKPLEEEYIVSEAAEYAEPAYAKLIEDKLINISKDGYKLLLNLERGIGEGIFNNEIASSVQFIFTKTILALANWLKNYTQLDRLAYAGWGSGNVATNTEVSCIYPNIAISPAYGALGVSLGAAALIDRPLWEHPYLGVTSSKEELPDLLANKLLAGRIETVNVGKQAFSHKNLGYNSKITIPFTNNIKAIGRYTVVCQEKEYHKLFSGINNLFGLTYSYATNKEHTKVLANKVKVHCVSSSSYPYLNRVLEVTKQQGYPILAIEDK